MDTGLVRAIGEPERGARLRQATLTALANDGTCSIIMGSSATPLTGVRRLENSATKVNTAVWVLQQGYDLLVIGMVGGSGDLEPAEIHGPWSGISLHDRDNDTLRSVIYSNSLYGRLWRGTDQAFWNTRGFFPVTDIYKMRQTAVRGYGIADTAIFFDVIDYQRGISNVNGNQIQFAEAGYYWVWGHFRWSASATYGERYMSIWPMDTAGNPQGRQGTQSVSGENVVMNHVGVLMYRNANERAAPFVFQNAVPGGINSDPGFGDIDFGAFFVSK